MIINHKQITKWYKLKINTNGNVIDKSFNHYNDGWVEGEYPLPFDQSFTNQVAWSKDKWVKEFTYITNELKLL